MSYSLRAAQFDDGFKATRLGNWEVPALRDKAPAFRPPGFRTSTIVSDNGHLLPGTPKRMTSFATGYEAASYKRWPASPIAFHTGAATMGYKGIQTSYLPTSTIFSRNNPDSVSVATPLPGRACTRRSDGSRACVLAGRVQLPLIRQALVGERSEYKRAARCV